MKPGHGSPAPVDPNDPVSCAMDAIARMPAPLPTVAFLSMAGSNLSHIAKVLGVTPDVACKWRDMLCTRLRKHL